MLSFILISLAITLVIALGLILSQWPSEMDGEGGLDFANTLSGGGVPSQATRGLAMRDGYDLQMRCYPAQTQDAPLLVLVHGSGWHGLQFDDLAQTLSKSAEVIVPDLRGHGAAPGRRGDIEYIGQLEDDLADLITATHKEGQKVVLAGHSSGGGLVVRFAGGEHRDLIDSAVLMAPYLHHNAPTMRPNAGGWTQILLRRIVGLSMLNIARITVLNHLKIVQFNMPKQVLEGPLGDTATTAYSYRLNTSFAPRGAYQKDIAALPPFLLIVGDKDDAFIADQYEPVMSAASAKGRYLIVKGVNHLDIVNTPETLAAIEEFLRHE